MQNLVVPRRFLLLSIFCFLGRFNVAEHTNASLRRTCEEASEEARAEAYEEAREEACEEARAEACREAREEACVPVENTPSRSP